MKVRRLFLAALGVMALASVTVFGATGVASTAKKAATSCSASVGIEAPLTGPVAEIGLQQLHFAQLAVANDNAANGTSITLDQNDTQLTASIATQKSQSIISGGDVAVVGPAGSQEVEAVGPLFKNAGIAFITGSATLPVLANGANPTFFRVVPNDNVQGPNDARYVINHLDPKKKPVTILNDNEAYSNGLVAVMKPVLAKAHIKVDVETFTGADTGTKLAGELAAIVTAHVTKQTAVVLAPIQTATQAQQVAILEKQQHKTAIVFGTDGTNSPSQFNFPGSYVSGFGPDIATNKSALDKSIVTGVAKYGPYGAFGLPVYAAEQVVDHAIASVCKSGATPSRANVLAAIKATNIPAGKNPLGVPIKFKANGELAGTPTYLFHVNKAGKYAEIPPK